MKSQFKTIAVDRVELIRCMNACNGVKYHLGSKPAFNETPMVDFKTSDCSGYVRWLLYQTTGGEVELPAGSWYQEEWARDLPLKATGFTNCGLRDNRIRLCFLQANAGEERHVWLCVNGQTIECCGGRGVCRRPWNTLQQRGAIHTYVLTDPMP